MQVDSYKIIWPDELALNVYNSVEYTAEPGKEPLDYEADSNESTLDILFVCGAIVVAGIAVAYTLDRNAKDTADMKQTKGKI